MTQHHDDLKALLANMEKVQGELQWLRENAKHSGSSNPDYERGFNDGMNYAYGESADMLDNPIDELKRILAVIAEDAAYQALQQPVPPSAGQLPLFDDESTP